MDQVGPLQLPKVQGLLAAGLVAWVLSVSFDLMPQIVLGWLTTDAPGSQTPISLGTLGWYALIGLPIAVAFTTIIGLLVWITGEAKGLHSRFDAMWLGFCVGILLGILTNLGFPTISRIIWSNTGGSFSAWSMGLQTYRGGLPTLVGWAFHLSDVLATGITGVVTAWTAWTVAKGLSETRKVSHP